MKLSLFRNPAAAIEVMAGFVVATSFLALAFAIMPGTGDSRLLGGLNGVVSALLCLLIAHRLSLGVKDKGALCAWAGAFLATAILSLAHWLQGDIARLPAASRVEDIVALGLWLVTPTGFLTARRSDRFGRFQTLVLIAGFGFQSLSTLLHLLDGRLNGATEDNAGALAVLGDLSEFGCLQLYLIGLTLFAASIRISRQSGEAGLARDPLAVGTQARRLFTELNLFAKGRFPRHPIAHIPGVRYLIEIGRTVRWFGTLSKPVRRRFGKPINRQFQEIILLMLRDGLDAQAYYMMELFRDGRLDQAGRYLARYETKNGLFKALHKTLAPENWLRTKLGNKRKFAEFCDEAGVPTIPTFATFERGEINWRTADRTALDRDLFVKLGKGKGARGAAWYQRIAPERYRAQDGGESSLDEIVESLRVRSLETPIILQPRVVNHPDIAAFATNSLLVVRVITCLNRQFEPETTYGMLRILSKLEPTWPTISEFGVPVDLETGRLGALTGDKIHDALEWHSLHPITQAPVEGTILPCWPQIRELAVTAHRASKGRLLIGWDIALTSQGPLVVEGNGLLDIVFPQRVHRMAAGTSPLGPLLAFHLERLEALRRGDKPSVEP